MASAAQPVNPSTHKSAPGPVRAWIRFLLAAMFFLLARVTADRSAHGLVREDWVPLVQEAMFAFLLLVGYAAFGIALERQHEPVGRQGLSLRLGWPGEAGLGLAFGWAIAVACVLPTAVPISSQLPTSAAVASRT